MSRLLFILLMMTAALPYARAQDAPEPSAAPDTSEQVEESDEAFRRRMELEDARYRDPTYVDPQDGYRRELEKIDRLPEASRDNIREQLIDIIVENGEWSPEDARREYPYRPSAAAQDDPSLASREQEAWDEQIEKYHAREAEAFGAYRGPVSGPGNPDGADGGAEGGSESGDAGQSGQSGQAGQAGERETDDRAGASGTYEPSQAGKQAAEDAASRAGVSESALDYVLRRQAGSNGSAAAPPSAEQNPASQQAQAADDTRATAAATEPAESDESAPQDLRGILAIEDLDKLGDSVRPPPPREESETPPDDGR